MKTRNLFNKIDAKYRKIVETALSPLEKGMSFLSENFWLSVGLAGMIATYGACNYYGYQFYKQPEFKPYVQLKHEYFEGKDPFRDMSLESKNNAENLMMFADLYFLSSFIMVLGAGLDTNVRRTLEGIK